MKVIFILIGCSMLLALGFLISYLWASKTGQFDDDYTPSVRMLIDNEEVKPKDSTCPTQTSQEK